MKLKTIFPWFKGHPTLTNGGFWSAFWGGSTFSGKPATLETAMQQSAFFACVRLTAQAISTMGGNIYEKQPDGGRVLVKESPLVDVLLRSPNIDQTPVEFWEGMVAWMLVNGNAYALEGRLTAQSDLATLTPMPSDCMEPFRDDNRVLKYRFNDRGKTEIYPREKIFHIRGFSFGGDVAPSIIRYAAQTISTGSAIEETAAKIFANGLSSSGFLQTDNELTEKQREEMREVMKTFTGSSNAGKLMVLEAGMKYQTMSLIPEDAQMLESRRWTIEEICRWFGIPPIIVGHAAQGQTMFGSGVEQILIAWLTLGLNPLMRRIESRIAKELTSNKERAKNHYFEFNREALLQADSAAKAQFLSTLTQNGLMTRNEGRAKLNLSRMDGADQLTVQMQMQPIQASGVPITPVSEPAKAKQEMFDFMKEMVSSMPAPVIHVDARTEVHPQKIDVAAAHVKVEPAKVDVNIAPPNITSHLHMPKRSDIKRTATKFDEHNNVIEMTETETDG